MKRLSWRGIGLLATCLAMFLAAGAFADDEFQEKGKGKGAKGEKGQGGIVQIDLGKLPPDLARQLMQYADRKGEKGKGEKGKGAATEAKTAKQLPPGLAKKPVDHPGRVAWLKAHSETKAPAAPKKGPGYAPQEKKGKGGESSSDVERRLDRLLMEIEELRREMRKKK
jgi:hypothetical protein